MKVLQSLCLAAFLFTCLRVGAVQEYYSLSRSVRGLGAGNAFYSLSNDEYALFYNPAGLSLYRGGGQIMLLDVRGQFPSGGVSTLNILRSAFDSSDISQIVNEISTLQGKPVSLGATVIPFYARRGFALGFLVADVKANIALLGVGIDSELDLTAITDSGLLIGKSFSLANNFHVGVTTKALLRGGGRKLMSLADFAQQSSVEFKDLGGFGVGLDFDLGVIYELPSPWLGQAMGFSATVSNVLATNFPLFRVEGAPPQLARMGSVGTYTIFKGGSFIHNVISRIELSELGMGGQSDPHLGARSGSIWKHVKLGLEFPVRGWLTLSTGIYQGSVTAGIGFLTSLMKLEFATYCEELASGVGRLSSRRYVLRLALGYSSASQKY